MPRKRLLLPLLLPVLPFFFACRHENAPPADAPASAREQPSTHLPDESPDWSGASNGNFESLVADYERKDRVIWQKPDMVISQLGDLTGKTVADIGAGTGYFTFRLVPKAEKVIGIDIDPRFIAFMDSVKVRLPQSYRERFETRLALPDNPKLQPGEADAVVVVNTYAYLDNRPTYLKTLYQGMTVGGILLIIDFKKNNLPVGPPPEYKIAHTQVGNELRAAGFHLKRVDIESLDYQYIVLAEKKAAPSVQ